MQSDLRDRYEADVRQLAVMAELLSVSGASPERIAHVLHNERRSLEAHYKTQTQEPLRSQILERTLAAYGDPLGPTIDFLRSKGKSWEQILASASRPGVLYE